MTESAWVLDPLMVPDTDFHLGKNIIIVICIIVYMCNNFIPCNCSRYFDFTHWASSNNIFLLTLENINSFLILLDNIKLKLLFREYLGNLDSYQFSTICMYKLHIFNKKMTSRYSFFSINQQNRIFNIEIFRHRAGYFRQYI